MVTNTATGSARSVVTDREGRYSLSNLGPGEYEISVEQQGFSRTTYGGVILTVGGSVIVDITMTNEKSSTEATILQPESLIEPTKVDLNRVVESQDIASLPNIGRNFVDFVKLSSGVALGRENVGGGPFKEPDLGIGSTAAPRLTFAGQSELSTIIQVDEAINVQTVTGLPCATPSQEAAREFRILNSTYLAEYGGSMAGFVNIVTKSGTNAFHGSAYYFGMNNRLNADSILATLGDNVLRQNQFGATFGGPIKQDRTFFFGNYEGQRRAESNRFSQLILNNINAINAVRTRLGLKPEGSSVRANDYDEFLIKVNDQLTSNNEISARYSFINSDTENFLGGSRFGSPASSAARNNFLRDQSLSVKLISVFPPAIVNEARFQFGRRSFDFPSVLKEPALEILNLVSMGKTPGDVDFYRETRIRFSDNVESIFGNHQLKVGAEVDRVRDNTQLEAFFPARIIFPNPDAFFKFTPVVFFYPYLSTAASHPGINPDRSSAVPAEWENDTFFHFNHNSYGFFAQDQWKVTRNLSLTFGLRYDFESYPKRFVPTKDLNNFQPRIGFAYTYNKKGVIRAGYGIYNDRIGGSIGQLFTSTEYFSAADLPNATKLFPDLVPITGRFLIFQIVGPAATPAATRFLSTGQFPANNTRAPGFSSNLAANLRTPYSQQASLQISQELGKGVLVSASYLYVHGLKIICHSNNLNAFQNGALPTGKAILGGRQFPLLGDFYVKGNFGMSIYHGGTFEVEKRFTNQLAVHASYTVSKTISNQDTIASIADFPESTDINLERSLSRQHVGQRFTLTFLSQIPKNIPLLHDFVI
ncbi:MAG: TonB-dependent receptor, partial [Acidobacteriota bacterium]